MAYRIICTIHVTQLIVSRFEQKCAVMKLSHVYYYYNFYCYCYAIENRQIKDQELIHADSTFRLLSYKIEAAISVWIIKLLSYSLYLHTPLTHYYGTQCIF